MHLAVVEVLVVADNTVMVGVAAGETSFGQSRCCFLPLVHYWHFFFDIKYVCTHIYASVKGLGCAWLGECAIQKVRGRMFTSYTVILRW